MPFISLCSVLALIIQLIVLMATEEKRRILRLLSIVIMESFPLTIMVINTINKPTGILGYRFVIIICFWIALSVLIGYILAWLIYGIIKR